MTDWPELPFIDTMMTTIVFYDVDRKLPVREAKEFADEVCGLLGEAPSHAHVGLEEGRKSRSPRYGTMLEKAIAKGDFDEYDYFYVVSYFEKGNVRDCSLTVGAKEIPNRRVEIHFRSDRQTPVDTGALLQAVLQRVSPRYGIRYDLTVREGPRAFITGIWSSGMPDELGRASGQFRSEYLPGNKFRDGYFRDVFSWNYLTQPQLDREIEGVRFEEWVARPLQRVALVGKRIWPGRLTPVEGGGAVWTLTPAEIRAVRPRMLAAGLLMVKD